MALLLAGLLSASSACSRSPAHGPRGHLHGRREPRHLPPALRRPDGRLALDGLAAETTSPSFLTTDPKGRLLLAVNENDKTAPGSGGVSSFAIDAKTGALRLLSQQPSGGAWPCHLVAGGQRPIRAGGELRRQRDRASGVGRGPLSPVVSRVDPKGKGPHARQDGSHAHGVYLDATNRRLLVPDLGLDKVLVYAFDASSGRLDAGRPARRRPGPGSRPAPPRLVARRALPPRGERARLHRHHLRLGPSGRLENRGTVKTLPDDFRGESTTAEIAAHPNGRFALRLEPGPRQPGRLRGGPGHGRLRRTAVVPVGGKTPRHFALAPSGRFLLAAHQDSNTIAVFRLDPATGGLAAVGDPVRVPRPVCLLFLPR